MMNYVVMTYYQLMYSIMHAKLNDCGVRTKLFLSSDYVEFDDNMIEEIRKTDIFSDVVRITAKPILREFFYYLKNDNPDKAFYEICDVYYSEIFGDISNSHFYIFNEFQLYYYYIEKKCKSISIIEDGYNSYKQQKKLLHFKGAFKSIDKYIGTYFPDVNGKSDKVCEFIVNSKVKPIEEHIGKIKYCDFKSMETKIGKVVLNSIYSKIFKYPVISKEKSVILLTQPLKRAQYCSELEQMRLYKKIIDIEFSKYDVIYIKPHPADEVDYLFLQNERVIILDKNFPIEVYNYAECCIDATYSFGSTASEIITCASKNDVLYVDAKKSIDRTKKFIKNYIKNSKISLLKVIHCDEIVSEHVRKENYKRDRYLNKKLTGFKIESIYKYNDFDSFKKAVIEGDFNYFINLKSSDVINKNMIRGLNFYFKKRSASVISLYSTLNFYFLDKNYILELDKKSLTNYKYDKIIARGLINQLETLWNGNFKFDSLDQVKNEQIHIFYFGASDLEEFKINVESELERKIEHYEDFLYYLNILKVAKIHGIKSDSLNISLEEHIDEYLRNIVGVSDFKLREMSRVKNSYLKIYYELKIANVLESLRGLKGKFR